MRTPKLVRKGQSSKWHLLTQKGDRTYCGVKAMEEIPGGTVGRVCSRCRSDFRSAAGIANMIEDSRARWKEE